MFFNSLLPIANIGSPMHWFILILVCLLIFGAKRLPDIARGLGKSLGEFKKARQEFEEELMKSESMAETKHIKADAEVESETKDEEKTEA